MFLNLSASLDYNGVKALWPGCGPNCHSEATKCEKCL